MKHILVCAVCLLALPAVVHAAPGLVMQYETIAWEEYPDLGLYSQPELVSQLFPDYDAAALVEARYAEYELPSRQRAGLITCLSQRPGNLAVVHYGSDGLSHLVLYSLPLAPGDQTTISLLLPVEVDTGVTRLMLWVDVPDSNWLELLARQPNWVGESIPGVLAQSWFERGGELAYSPPWVDEFRPGFEPPLYGMQADWPWCAAQPTIDGKVRGKDCSVVFDGRSRLAFDENGGFGQWALDWSTELKLEFSLPMGLSGTRTDLVIYGGLDPMTQFITQPAIKVVVNGWPLTTLESMEGIGSGMQPYTFEVSHYLSGGTNRILISTGTMSSAELLIDGLELWMY